MDKVNLATLCLNLYEGMEDCFAGCSYSVKPMPKDEAFNTYEIETSLKSS